jgi:hypothetical protein
MLLSWFTSPHLFLTPAARNRHISIVAFRWCVGVKAMLTGANEMLSVGSLQHQQSDATNNVSTPAFDRALLIVIPSNILKSV